MISRKYLILLAMLGTLVSFDQLTKLWIVTSFAPGDTLSLLPNYLQFAFVKNRGAAFGLMANLRPGLRDPLLFLIPGTVLALIFFAFTRLKEKQSISIYALSFVIGGAAGNIVDRLRLGYVVDFVDLHWQNQSHFPAFNLADAAITIGVGLLFLSLVLEHHPEEEDPAGDSSDEQPRESGAQEA